MAKKQQQQGLKLFLVYCTLKKIQEYKIFCEIKNIFYFNKGTPVHPVGDCGGNTDVHIIINHPLSRTLLILGRLKCNRNVN